MRKDNATRQPHKSASAYIKLRESIPTETKVFYKFWMQAAVIKLAKSASEKEKSSRPPCRGCTPYVKVRGSEGKRPVMPFQLKREWHGLAVPGIRSGCNHLKIDINYMYGSETPGRSV